MDIIIDNVQLSFPDLGDPVEYQQGDGKPRWNATFLVEPGSQADKDIRAAIKQVATEAWKDKAPQKINEYAGNPQKFCYLDGNKKAYDGYENKWYVSCHRPAVIKGRPNPPPLLIDSDKTPLPLGTPRLYAGCFVKAKISIWTQDGANGGIRASFSVIQFRSKGQAFSQSAPNADDFGNEGPSDFDEPFAPAANASQASAASWDDSGVDFGGSGSAGFDFGGEPAKGNDAGGFGFDTPADKPADNGFSF